MSRDNGVVGYLVSTLARSHLLVIIGAVLWFAAAMWQLWTFGNRPEVWGAAILMGLGAASIGYYLAVVNRVDSDERFKESEK